LGVFLPANPINAIVGIDPGVTTAVAILDLDGEVVKLKSSRSFSLRNIIKFLSLECTPVIIASDVSPAPRLLEKVATAFSVPLHTPAESLSRKSKSRLVNGFALKRVIGHKRDALAAAVSAYGTVVPMLKKIEKRLSKLSVSNKNIVHDVAGKIIVGECQNIAKAVKNICVEHKN
jgi:predicted RNase H-like nuclease (RuvC/YqgF family)